MSIRKEILVNTYPERYGLSLFIDNQQLYMESGKIRYYNDKLFKVIPVSIADINANGYSLVDGSGAYVENENVYKAFPFDDNVIDKDTRYQFKYDLKTLYYVIDDIRNNKRYIDVEFEKVKVLDAQDNDVTENFEPMFIIQNKEVRAFAGYLTSDNAIPIIENLDDDGFLNNFYILAEFKMPQQEVIDLNQDLSIYDYAEYKPIDFLDGSMFVDNGDGFLSTDNEIKLGLLDQSGQAQNTNLSFYVFIKGFLNIWDDPEKFGTIYIDQPQPEEAITAKYQTEPVGYYDGNSYLLQDVLIESKVNSQGQQEFDYYVSDYYPKFIDTVPEVIDARNIYDRKQSGDQEVLVLKKQFNSLGERLDSTYQEIELLKRQVNTDLPTSIVNSTQQLYGDIAQLENSIDDSISQMEQSVNSILSYAEIFQKMGEVLKRPTLTLFKTIQPHVVARNNLNIEYQTLADRLNAIDKDIYTNVFNIRDVFNRLEVVENIFSETPYNENIFITRDIEESGQLDLQQQLSEIRHITIEYAENQGNDITALSAFDFSNYFWVVGARGQVSDGANYITVENSNKILYKDIPLGLEVEYTINNVPIMKYDSYEELPGFRKFISNTNEIVSQSNSSQDRIDIIFEDPVYLNYDGISEEHDQQYDQRPFVAGDFWVNNLSYMDMDQEKQYLQNPNITTIEFYPNSNNVGNDPYMKSNGRYVSYSIFMGSYIPTVQNLNVTQQELYEIFQNNDFVYTFEIQQDKNAKKYNVRFHYLLKKFEISGEASLQDTNFLRILYRNRKIKGYINKQTYENSVNSSWNDILLGNTNTITVDGVYDEYGNYYPSATFYVLRTVRYRANKLQENDNRGILEFEGDFRYKLRKDRFRINVVNGERVEYYNVNDIRQSYLQPSQIEVQIQNNSIIMPHYNIYQGALNAQQVRSYFEIAKRLHIYRDALNTLSPIKSFYDELIQSGDNGGYNINVNGIIQADVISSIDKRLTDFIGEYADINNTVFGTLLFVDNTHIDFGQDTKNLGEAVFGLRFGDDNTTLYLDDSDIFYDGQLFHITQRTVDINNLSFGPTILTLYQVLTRNNNSAVYTMTTGSISGDYVRLQDIRVYRSSNFDDCNLRLEREDMYYSPFASIYELADLRQSFDILNNNIKQLNRSLASNPSFVDAVQTNNEDRGYFVFQDNSIDVELRHYYDYIDEVKNHVDGIEEFDNQNKDISTKRLIPYAVSSIDSIYNDIGIDYLTINGWLTNIDIVSDGIRVGVNNQDNFSLKDVYRIDGLFGPDPLTLDMSTEEHAWENDKQITRYQFSGNILKKHEYQQRENFLVERFYIPADYDITDLRYMVKYAPEVQQQWEGAQQPISKVQNLNLMRQDFYRQDAITGEDEVRVGVNGETALVYNTQKIYPYKIYPDQVKYIVLRYMPDGQTEWQRYLIYSSDPLMDTGNSISTGYTEDEREQLILSNVPNFQDNTTIYNNFERIEVYFEGVYLDKYDDLNGQNIYLYNIDPQTISFTQNTDNDFYMMDNVTSMLQANYTEDNFYHQSGRYIYLFTSEYENNANIKTIQQLYKIPLNVIDLLDPQQNVEIIGKPVQPYTIHDAFTYSIYGYAQVMSDNIQEQFNIDIQEEKFVFKLRVVRGQQFSSTSDSYVYAPIFFMNVGVNYDENKMVMQVYNQTFSALDLINARYSNISQLMFENIGDRFEWIEGYLLRRFEGSIGEIVTVSTGDDVRYLDINNYTTEDLQLFESTYVQNADIRYVREDTWKFMKSIFQTVEDVLTLRGQINFNNTSYNDMPILLSDIKIDDAIQDNKDNTQNYASQDAHLNNNGRQLEKRFAYQVYFDDLIQIDQV